MFAKVKREESEQKAWNFFNQFGITIPSSATYCLEVGAHISLKVATKGSIRGKTLWKFIFLGSLSQLKTEEWDQKFWNVLDQFGIIIPFSDPYFLKAFARVSLKVANKGSIRAEKTVKI